MYIFSSVLNLVCISASFANEVAKYKVCYNYLCESVVSTVVLGRILLFIFNLAAMALHGAYFGEGSGPIWLDEVICFGSESDLLSCYHNQLGVHNCGHFEDAGVRCTGTFRIVFML